MLCILTVLCCVFHAAFGYLYSTLYFDPCSCIPTRILVYSNAYFSLLLCTCIPHCILLLVAVFLPVFWAPFVHIRIVMYSACIVCVLCVYSACISRYRCPCTEVCTLGQLQRKVKMQRWWKVEISKWRTCWRWGSYFNHCSCLHKCVTCVGARCCYVPTGDLL